MDDREKLYEGRQILNDICAALDQQERKYTRNDEKLQVTFTAYGEDMPIDFKFIVHYKNQAVRLLGYLPFHAKENVRYDMAVAVAAANYGLILGQFDFDLSDGELRYRMSERYADSRIGYTVYQRMISTSVGVIEDYADKLMHLNKGMIDLERCLKLIKEADDA